MNKIIIAIFLALINTFISFVFSKKKIQKTTKNRKNQTNKFPYLTKANINRYKKNNISVKDTYLLDNNNNKKFVFINKENNESRKIASDKAITSRILQLNNIPVPNYISFDLNKNNFKFLKKQIKINLIKYPLVLKPLQSHQGKGITLDIKNFKELKKNIIKLSKQNIKKGDKIVNFTEFIIEEFKQGESFRIFIIKDSILSVYGKKKPYVIGDGKHNVLQLIKIYNKNIDTKINFKISNFDKKLVLSQTKLDSIVPKNKKIILSHIASRHNGSHVFNVKLSSIHPDNIQIFKEIQKEVGLKINGIDYITNDITKSWKEGDGFINEINSGPGLTGELFVNRNNLDKFFNKFIKILRSHKSLWI